MNVEQMNEVFSADATNLIDVKTLSKSLSYLISGSRGLKQNEIVFIPSQECRLDSFDLGEGRKSKETLCVAGVITDKHGNERGQKFSLAQLKRRTYGKTLKSVKSNEYPSVETTDIEMNFKSDEEAQTVTLLNDIKFKVAKIETHYVSVFDDVAMKSKLDSDNNVILESKNIPILQQIK
jgi:hypothetical protein